MKKEVYIKPQITIIHAMEEGIMAALSTRVDEDPYPDGGDAKQRDPWALDDWSNNSHFEKAAHYSAWE